MLVYGKNVFDELRDNLKQVRRVYLSNKSVDKELITKLEQNKIRYELIDVKRLDKIVDGKHQGIIAEIHDYEYLTIQDLMTENTLVILDHLEDPHNFGAIIRTCEAAGIKGIIIPKDRSVSVNATVMKTSSGALSHVKIAMVNNLTNAINKLKDNNYFIYGTAANGKNYQQVDYASKKVIVIGSEGKGMSRIVQNACDEIISIPMHGKINSLNASVAAAIIIYGIIK